MEFKKQSLQKRTVCAQTLKHFPQCNMFVPGYQHLKNKSKNREKMQKNQECSIEYASNNEYKISKLIFFMKCL